jgi:hypothetical protein
LPSAHRAILKGRLQPVAAVPEHCVLRFSRIVHARGARRGQRRAAGLGEAHVQPIFARSGAAVANGAGANRGAPVACAKVCLGVTQFGRPARRLRAERKPRRTFARRAPASAVSARPGASVERQVASFGSWPPAGGARARRGGSRGTLAARDAPPERGVPARAAPPPRREAFFCAPAAHRRRTSTPPRRPARSRTQRRRARGATAGRSAAGAPGSTFGGRRALARRKQLGALGALGAAAPGLAHQREGERFGRGGARRRPASRPALCS